MGGNNGQSENSVTIREGNAGALMGADIYSANMDALVARFDAIKKLYSKVMLEGQDYGTIPGAGERKTLLKPGSEKLMMLCQLAPVIKKDEIVELGNGHREYRMTVIMQHRQTGEIWGEGVGSATTMESKHRYRYLRIKCPSCGRDLFKSKEKDEYFCWAKKNGCGAVFPTNAPELKGQIEGKGENTDIADVWNTVYKMCHKRAVVSAVIIATGVSNMFTQDVEDFEDQSETGNDDHGKPEETGNKSTGSNNKSTTGTPAGNGKTSAVFDLQQLIEAAETEEICGALMNRIDKAAADKNISDAQSKQLHKILDSKLLKIQNKEG